MSDWDKVKVGTPITGFDAHNILQTDNLVVVALGHSWAVLQDRESGKMCPCILEPLDNFMIGEHLYDEDGSMIANVEE